MFRYKAVYVVRFVGVVLAWSLIRLLVEMIKKGRVEMSMVFRIARLADARVGHGVNNIICTVSWDSGDVA